MGWQMKAYLDSVQWHSPKRAWYDTNTCSERGHHMAHNHRCLSPDHYPTRHPHNHSSPQTRPPPRSPSPPNPATSVDLMQVALKAHNDVRSGPPLVWDTLLAKESLEQAQAIITDGSCNVATVNQWDMNPDAPFGRNTFAIQGASCDWDSVVRSWSAEKIDPRNLNTGAHKFQTQGVSVERVGCAQASSEQCHAFVCQYSPKQTVMANGNFEDALSGPEIPCPQTCGGVLPCRNTEL